MLKRREAIGAPAGNLTECVSRGRECRVPIDEALRDRFGLVEAAKFAQFGREFAGVPWVGGIALGGDAEMFERRDAVAAPSGNLPERVPRGCEGSVADRRGPARSLRPRRGARVRAVRSRPGRRAKGLSDRARRRRGNVRAPRCGRRAVGQSARARSSRVRRSVADRRGPARSLRPRRGDRGRAVVATSQALQGFKGSRSAAAQKCSRPQHGRHVRGRLQPCAFRRSRYWLKADCLPFFI